jgi:hypothetical protein
MSRGLIVLAKGVNHLQPGLAGGCVQRGWAHGPGGPDAGGHAHAALGRRLGRPAQYHPPDWGRLEHLHLGVQPGDFTGIASPTSSHAPAVDCCTFMQATDRVDGCNLGSSVEDGTCSPPSSALGTSMVAASPTLSLTAGLAPCGCIPVTAPAALCSARLWARGGVSSPPSLPEALTSRPDDLTRSDES